MARKKKEQGFLSLEEIFAEMGETLQSAEARPNLNNYVPHDKQLEFHSSTEKERLFIGGNRSGKSIGGVTEAIMWLTKKHEHREFPNRPIRGRVVTVNFREGLEQIILPLFRQWVPPSELIDGSWERSYSRSLNKLTLANGSTCDFLTYEQDTDKHAGTSRDFVFFDEEPPWDIYEENLMRLIDTDGEYWIAMTPLLGMTWVYDKLYLPGIEGRDEFIKVVEVYSGDNPHLKTEARTRLTRHMEDEARKAREEGRFVELGGLVFKTFDKKQHTISTTSPLLSGGLPHRNWEWYMSMDSGWNNPTAIYWHAVSPHGLIITFGEHYQSEMTVAEHAQVIKLKEQEWRRVADLRTGDPAMKQTRENTGTSVQQEYAKHEIYLALDNVPTGPGSVDIGIQKMQQYLQQGYWLILDDCPNLINEMGRLHWQTYQSRKLSSRLNPQEKVAAKDDHGFDAVRYLFTLMPDLSPDNPNVVRQQLSNNAEGMRYDEALVRMHELHEQGELEYAPSIADLENSLANDYTAWYT